MGGRLTLGSNSCKNISFIVAIDGPAGAGKSTVAKNTAARLKFDFLDTGAMYRSLALFALEKDINLEKTHELQELMKEFEIDISTDGEGGNKVVLNGQDISEAIRRPVVSQAVSYVADDLNVRNFLVQKQRELAKGKKCVLEGRDIGTVVFPDADIKFYLTASLDERARRRGKELKEKGYTQGLEEIKDELRIRDEKDKNRKVGALKKASDAITLDTTNYSLDEVIGEIENMVISEYNKKVGTI